MDIGVVDGDVGGLVDAGPTSRGGCGCWLRWGDCPGGGQRGGSMREGVGGGGRVGAPLVGEGGGTSGGGEAAREAGGEALKHLAHVGCCLGRGLDEQHSGAVSKLPCLLF